MPNNFPMKVALLIKLQYKLSHKKKCTNHPPNQPYSHPPPWPWHPWLRQPSAADSPYPRRWPRWLPGPATWHPGPAISGAPGRWWRTWQAPWHPVKFWPRWGTKMKHTKMGHLRLEHSRMLEFSCNHWNVGSSFQRLWNLASLHWSEDFHPDTFLLRLVFFPALSLSHPPNRHPSHTTAGHPHRTCKIARKLV